MYDGDQFEPETIDKKNDEGEQSPGPQGNDALDLGDDYDEDEDDGVAGNERDSNTGAQKKGGSNPYQLNGNGAGGGRPSRGAVNNNRNDGMAQGQLNQKRMNSHQNNTRHTSKGSTGAQQEGYGRPLTKHQQR